MLKRTRGVPVLAAALLASGGAAAQAQQSELLGRIDQRLEVVAADPHYKVAYEQLFGELPLGCRKISQFRIRAGGSGPVVFQFFQRGHDGLRWRVQLLDQRREPVRLCHLRADRPRVVPRRRVPATAGVEVERDLRLALGVVDGLDRTLEGLQPPVDVLERARLLHPRRPRELDIHALG